jgi:hypothetical protein
LLYGTVVNQVPSRSSPLKSEFITEPTPSAEDNPIAEGNPIAEDNPISEDQQPAPQDSEASPQEDSQRSTLLTEPVTFLVSSRHLILASPVFKAMLTGGWKEGDKNNGPLQVGAEDWDAEALVIVMNVLHSHCHQVPKTISLEMLAKIAVIVDYYKIHEAVQIIASLWVKALEKTLPSSLGRDVILWILVSSVFGDATIFRQVTKVAILWSREDMKIPCGLPIPPAVIGKVLTKNNELIVRTDNVQSHRPYQPTSKRLYGRDRRRAPRPPTRLHRGP